MTPIEHIQEQKIIKRIVSTIRKNPVEVIINEPGLSGLVISAIYKNVEGRMGVVVPDDKYLNNCQANIQNIDEHQAFAFQPSFGGQIVFNIPEGEINGIELKFCQ